MKGISAVVATILLLLITIALATTAYFYITNFLSGKTSKVVSVVADCTNGKISLIVSNVGQTDIVNTGGTGDLKILVDNKLNTTDFEENGASGDVTYTIPVRGVVALVNKNTVSSSSQYRIVVATPNHEILTVFC